MQKVLEYVAGEENTKRRRRAVSTNCVRKALSESRLHIVGKPLACGIN